MTDLAPTPVSITARPGGQQEQSEGGYRFTDRITNDTGTVFASGVQAVARILVEQLRVDRTNGLNTAAFASGYPGSPLASLDKELTIAAKLVGSDLPLIFTPGLNEELAATAVMGSQLTMSHGDNRFDGVIGMWFGKAPGIDRACDAIRHGVFGGTHPTGGVLCVVGDDPGAKSSTLPSSSDATLVDLHIPILYPVDVQDALDLGRHGIALSRASGLWAGLKMVANVADGTATISLDPLRVQPIMPTFLIDGVQYVPKPNARFLPPYNLAMEKELLEVRLEVARLYGVVNNLNRVTVDPGLSARIGIAASGYTYAELREALSRLGLRTDAEVAAAGIRLLCLRMPYPLDESVIRDFARGLPEIIVVEEKNPTLEWMMKDALWGAVDRPVIVGKHDTVGSPLFARSGHLDADAILSPLRRRLALLMGDEHLAALPQPVRQRIELTQARSPWFCSGCPHHWGTKVPEGSLVGAGIGCHGMTVLQEEERVGELASICAMGNEGTAWIGMAPFVERAHLIQNLGDGTYFHSGQLAVQASVASGINITYKLLHNGAVAMTGGQDAQGRVGVPEIAQIMLLQGVKRVLITTDDVSGYRGVDLPDGVVVWDRTRIVEAQEMLRDIPGVTVLIHDQACAAELRRDRKRGIAVTPSFRVVINERVCEGCGHCGETSGCLSVQPIETEFGRKTRIDQTSCNLDASCLHGDCPSFMTVEVDPTKPISSASKPKPSAPTEFPKPVLLVSPLDCTIRMAGIGGTGVVTVSQVLGTAALLEGKSAKGLDQTGLSQKAGPVVSDIRIGLNLDAVSNKAGKQTADVLLAFDLLVGAGDSMAGSLATGKAYAVCSTTKTPTGSMVIHPDQLAPDESVLIERLRSASGNEPTVFDAAHLTNTLLGDTTTANIAIMGAAFQRGLIPLDAASIEEAIGLNGVAVAKNLSAFRWGRACVADRPLVDAALADQAETVEAPLRLSAKLENRVVGMGTRPALLELLRSRTSELVAFQNDRCASTFLDRVELVAQTERQVMGDHESLLTEAVIRHLYQLTAYKDEYEVARLLISPTAKRAAEAVGGTGAKLTWKLHPPMLRSLGMKNKIALGPSTRPLLVALAAGKRLRGTPFDVFGRAHVRKLERSLLAEYEEVLNTLVSGLTISNHAEAVRTAKLPDHVRGYEDRKVIRAAEYRELLRAALADWRSA
jgi:indolepyruvate ferredoxin oxidoreductase